MLGGGYVNRFNYYDRSYKVIPQLGAENRETVAPLLDLIGGCREPYGRMCITMEFADVDDPAESGRILGWAAILGSVGMALPRVVVPAPVHLPAGGEEDRGLNPGQLGREDLMGAAPGPEDDPDRGERAACSTFTSRSPSTEGSPSPLGDTPEVLREVLRQPPATPP